MEVDWGQILNEVLKESIKAIVLVLIIGLIAKQVIEKYKQRLSLTNELSKVRVDRISECWKSQNDYLLKFHKLDSKMREMRLDDGTEDERAQRDREIVEEFMDECNSLNNELDEIEAIIHGHRFWLGRKVEKKTLFVFELLKEYYEAFCGNNLDFCIEHRKKIEASMMDVDEVLYYLLRNTRYRWFKRLFKSSEEK